MAKNNEKLEELSAEALIFKLIADKVGAYDPTEVFFAQVLPAGPNAGKYSATLGGKKLTPNQLSNLQAEAMLFEKSELWKICTDTLRHGAELKMLRDAKTTEDMYWGKALMHSVGVLEHIVKAIQGTMSEGVAKPFEKAK